MNKKKTIVSFSLVVLSSFSLFGCGAGGSSSVSSDSLISSSNSSDSSTTDGYDTNWTPGENALRNADQPSVKNPKGDLSPLGEMRKSQNKFGLPQKGEANLLVVPVEFKSASTDDKYTEDQEEALYDAYFGAGVAHSDYPSVQEYYDTSSYGNFLLSGVVSPVVTLPYTFSEYGIQIGNNSVSKVLSEIAKYVYNYLFVETETYYDADFDADDDGKVDGISIVYKKGDLFSSTASFTTYEAEILQSTTYFNNTLSAYLDETPDLSSVTWTNYDIIEVSASTAGVSVKYDNRYMIKEIGAMLGLDSMADTSSTRYPFGGLDMMDSAINDHNSFSKYQLGWIEPRKIKTEDVTSAIEITLTPFEYDGQSILLSYKDVNQFDEYLLVDFYTSNGLNFNVEEGKSGVRVTKVDARLVRGNATYSMYDGDPDYSAKTKDVYGKEANYIYDYAFTNSSTNKYEDYGIIQNFALATVLDRNGSNRHMTTAVSVTPDDFFQEGDIFGKESYAEGFYHNFAFDGNGVDGPELGLKFSVNSIQDDEAVITIERA